MLVSIVSLTSGLFLYSACIQKHTESSSSNPCRRSSPFKIIFRMLNLHVFCLVFFGLVMSSAGSASTQSGGNIALSSCLMTAVDTIVECNWSDPQTRISSPSHLPTHDSIVCRFYFDVKPGSDFASRFSACPQSSIRFLDAEIDMRNSFVLDACVASARATKPAAGPMGSFRSPLHDAEGKLRRHRRCPAIPLTMFHSLDSQCRTRASLRRCQLPCEQNAYISRLPDIERSSVFFPGLFSGRRSDVAFAWLLLLCIAALVTRLARAVSIFACRCLCRCRAAKSRSMHRWFMRAVFALIISTSPFCTRGQESVNPTSKSALHL
jgi:hypothetical protein